MKLFSILRKDLQILLRDRANLFMLFLVPLAFIISISLALGAGDGYRFGRSDATTSLPIVNYDAGPRAQELLTTVGESLPLVLGTDSQAVRAAGLAEEPRCQPLDQNEEGPRYGPACAELVAQHLLRTSSRTAVLIIPPGFSDNVNAGRRTWVTLLYDPSGSSIRLQRIESVVQAATLQLTLENRYTSSMNQLLALSTFGPDSLRAAVADQARLPEEDPDRPPALSIIKTSPTDSAPTRTPDTYQQTIPGFTVMFVFFVVFGLASSIRDERSDGTFRRLLGMPVSRLELVASKLLATMVIGMAQVAFLFAAGVLLFNLQLGQDLPALVLLTLMLVTAASALGLAISTTNISRGRLVALLVAAAFIGGCVVPLGLMPPVVRMISFVVPHSWAMNGFLNLLVREMGIRAVLPHLAALLGFALLFFVIAARRLNLEA
jgi:ABC-2 type transport system permease protein